VSARPRDPAALRPQSKPDPCHLWPTPPCLTWALVTRVLPYLPPGPVWECAAGDGRLADAMRAAGRIVLASDILPRGPDIECRDFLHEDPPQLGLIAVTNSPFAKHLTRFMRRGLQLLDLGQIAGLVLLMRHDAFQAAERVYMVNRAVWREHCVWRAVWIEGSRGNPRWTCEWVTWLPGRTGPPRTHGLLPEQVQRQASLPLGYSEQPRPKLEKSAAKTASYRELQRGARHMGGSPSPRNTQPSKETSHHDEAVSRSVVCE
jgi:hypothetical protein